MFLKKRRIKKTKNLFLKIDLTREKLVNLFRSLKVVSLIETNVLTEEELLHFQNRFYELNNQTFYKNNQIHLPIDIIAAPEK